MLDVAYWQGIPGFMDRIRVGQEKSRNSVLENKILKRVCWSRVFGEN